MLIELITWEFDYFLNENYRVRELIEGVSEGVQLTNFNEKRNIIENETSYTNT